MLAFAGGSSTGRWARKMTLTRSQRFVLKKLLDGLRLWQHTGFRSTGKWGLERPIIRDLQEEENYSVASRTAHSLWRHGWIESDGTGSSLSQRVYYQLTNAGRERIAPQRKGDGG